MVLELKKHKPKILVADDEASIRRILDVRLSLMGYDVITASDGEEALDVFGNQDPNLLILDVMMPKLDGYRVCQALRAKSNVPIIMLTALSDVADRIAGLELGADDYMVKPFSLKELESRIRCVFRRSFKPSSHHSEETAGVTQFGLLRIDTNKRQAYRENERIKLTELEFDLLELLASRLGEPVSRIEVLERLWGFIPDRYDDKRVVDVHVSRLRQKLREASIQDDCILAVRGVGYRLQVSE